MLEMMEIWYVKTEIFKSGPCSQLCTVLMKQILYLQAYLNSHTVETLLCTYRCVRVCTYLPVCTFLLIKGQIRRQQDCVSGSINSRHQRLLFYLITITTNVNLGRLQVYWLKGRVDSSSSCLFIGSMCVCDERNSVYDLDNWGERCVWGLDCI